MSYSMPDVYIREQAWIELRDALIAKGFEPYINPYDATINMILCRVCLKDDNMLAHRIRDVILDPGDHGAEGGLPPVNTKGDAMKLTLMVKENVPALSIYPEHQIYRVICEAFNIPWSTIDAQDERLHRGMG